MKQNSKISAFTISEMIVVIILTSIVIGLAFSVLSLVQKQMESIKFNYNQSAILHRLESRLWLDMNRFPKATFDDDKNELTLSSEIDSVSYQFNKENIICSNDTFFIEVENHLIYFTGDQVDNGKVDAIKITVTKAVGGESVFVYKHNDATAFMN